MTKIITVTADGKPAFYFPLPIDHAPQVGDLIRARGSCARVLRRRFAEILAPDMGINPGEYALVLTVENCEDPDPLPKDSQEC